MESANCSNKKRDQRLISVEDQRRISGQRGFTIIEMLVVIFIIGVLSVLSLAAYREGQKRYELAQATQKIISDLRKIQNMAMSGSGISAATQYNGYGIHFNKAPGTYYRIYGNNKNDADFRYNSGDVVIETVSIPASLKILRLYYPASTQVTDLYIAFSPPDPTLYFNNETIVGSSASIFIKVDNTSLEINKTITVSSPGLITSD